MNEMTKLTILQWNIWFKEKPENIIKLLKELDPDIICLQELTIGYELHEYMDVPKYISKTLGYQYNFSHAHTFESGYKQGNAIFSRLPIVEKSNFIIAESGVNEDYSSEGRSCAVAKIDILNQKFLMVATAHSSYNSAFIENDKKISEINNLINFFQKNKKNLIFAGDLNIAPDSQSVQNIEHILTNAGPSYSESTWTTKPFAYEKFKENQLRWRLDYLFASNDTKVISTKIIQTDYSDHLPILTEIEV